MVTVKRTRLKIYKSFLLATRMLRIKRNSGKCMHLFFALFVIFHCRFVSVLSYFVPLDVEIIEQTKVLFLLWTRMSHYLCQKKETRLMSWHLLALYRQRSDFFPLSERPIKIVFYIAIDLSEQYGD